MPNWCDNILIVTGEGVVEFFVDNRGDVESLDKESLDKESLDNTNTEDHDDDAEIIQELRRQYNNHVGQSSNSIYGNLLSFTKALDDTHDCMENINVWGTKWDVDEVTVLCEQDELTYVFQTAWSPPLEWLHHVGKLYPHLEFKLSYNEPGYDFRGQLVIENGIVQEDFCTNYYRDATPKDVRQFVYENLDNFIQESFTQEDVRMLFKDDNMRGDIEVFCENDDCSELNVHNVCCDGEILSTDMHDKVFDHLLRIAKQRAEHKLYMIIKSLILIRRVQRKFIDNYYKPFGKFEQNAKLKFDLLKVL